VLAVIGVVANDAFVAVPFTMLIVVGPAAILRALAAGDRPAAAPPGAGAAVGGPVAPEVVGVPAGVPGVGP
jgi:hypothetical protein